MNAQLVESLVQAIRSLSEDERCLWLSEATVIRCQALWRNSLSF